MPVTASRRRLGTKWWGLWTLALLLSLFAFAAFSIGWDNPTIRLLGYVALVVMPFLIRAVVVLGRRAAGAAGERQGGSEALKHTDRAVRIAGIGLVLLGLVLLLAGSPSWATSLRGLVVAMAGVLLVRISLDRAAPAAGSGEAAGFKAIRRFDRLMRAVGIALMPLMAFSLAFLYLDAASGYHQRWPLYTFFIVALASALVWPYLVARAFGKLLRR